MKHWPLLLMGVVVLTGCAPKAAPPNSPTAPPEKNPSGSAPSSIESSLYGRWIGKKAEQNSEKNGKKSNAQGELSNSMADLMGGFSIDLNPDYTFRMDLAGTNLDGSWELKGEDVRLTVEHVMGKTRADYASAETELDKEFASMFEKPPTPKVRDSGKRLAIPHEAAKGIVFTKGK